MKNKKLAKLLYQANANPPVIYRGEFYAMKSKLLAKHARLVNNWFIQRIVKLCWECEGTGKLDDGSPCWRCKEGVYDKFYIRHLCYYWHGYRFLVPFRERIYKDPGYVDLDGYVVHNEVSILASRNAQLILFWHNDRAVFWRLFTRGCLVKPGRYPLLWLNFFAFKLRGFSRRLKQPDDLPF